MREDPNALRDIIGVCPQHDILWNDLTAREHMEIFCDIRCIPREEMNEVIKQRLEDVQLYEVRAPRGQRRPMTGKVLSAGPSSLHRWPTIGLARIAEA